METFDFSAAPPSEPLLGVVEILKAMNAAKGREVPDDTPTGFVKPRWEPHVFAEDGSLFGLAWYQDLDLRRRVNAGLNKGLANRDPYKSSRRPPFEASNGGLSCPYRTFARDHAFLPIKSAEGALQYGLQYEAQNRLRGLHTRFAFYLQNSTFYSGAEGNRTPDLRRAKSDPKHRSCSLTFKIACKTALLPLEVFVSVRCCSRGLVYYWCRRTSGSSLL